jgi:hypothetical protein
MAWIQVSPEEIAVLTMVLESEAAQTQRLLNVYGSPRSEMHLADINRILQALEDDNVRSDLDVAVTPS